MGWFRHNLVADIPFTEFLRLHGTVIGLTLYIIVTVLTLVGCWWRVRKIDSTPALHPLAVPSEPDPYEVAYLTGVESANASVAQVMVLSLIERGYLDVEPKQAPTSLFAYNRWLAGVHIVKAANTDLGRLSAMERAVYDWFTKRNRKGEWQPKKIYDRKGQGQQERFYGALQNYCTPYEERLRTEQLITPAKWKAAARRIGWGGALIILGMAGCNILGAWLRDPATLDQDKVNDFLVPSMFALMGVAQVCTHPPVTHRGRTYLQQLRQAFAHLKTQAASTWPQVTPAQVTPATTRSPSTIRSPWENSTTAAPVAQRANVVTTEMAAWSSTPSDTSQIASPFHPNYTSQPVNRAQPNRNLLLIVGLFGAQALRHTAYEAFAVFFTPPSDDGGGGGE